MFLNKYHNSKDLVFFSTVLSQAGFTLVRGGFGDQVFRGRM